MLLGHTEEPLSCFFFYGDLGPDTKKSIQAEMEGW